MAERLAIDGGRPVRATSLPYGRHGLAEEDVQAVVAALCSDWLTTGPQVPAFERAVAIAGRGAACRGGQLGDGGAARCGVRGRGRTGR